MSKPTIQIHDLEKDEIITREMTNAEFVAYELIQNNLQAQIAEAEAKAQAKEAARIKLAALGLTVEDLQALGL